MRSWPIWNDVSACVYKGSKSWGARDVCEVTVKVGTSARNSVELVDHWTSRREQGPYTVFAFGYRIPGTAQTVVVRRLWMHTKTHEWHTDEPAELRDAA